MSPTQIEILSAQDLSLILKRMTYQVLEFFYGKDEIHIVGIQEGGMHVAQRLEQLITQNSKIKTQLLSIALEKDAPIDSLELSAEIPQNASILIVDDVANSGRTLAYVLAQMLKYSPRQIKIAVLVDRKHKRFPIQAEIVGRKLSTNLSETVKIKFDTKGNPLAAYLTDKEG